MSLTVRLPTTLFLQGLRVLVVEDSYFVAGELTEMLEREGAEVVGPASTMAEAQRLIMEVPRLDAAILDVRLHGQMIWPVADDLSRRSVKIVFASGYSSTLIKKRYRHAHVVQKPAPARMVARILALHLHA